MEQEKREKLVTERDKEEQRTKENPKTKEVMASSVKEKVEKEKAGKRLITPEKAKSDKKQKASTAVVNPPREALAPLTNRFQNKDSFLNFSHQFLPARENRLLPPLYWQSLLTLLLTLRQPSGLKKKCSKVDPKMR